MGKKIKELKHNIEIAEDTKNKENQFNTNKIPINKISNDIEKALKNNIEQKKENNTIIFPDKAYKKDILKTIPNNLSPIILDKNKEVEKGDSAVMIKEENTVNLNDFIKKNNVLNSKENKINSKNISFLEEISKQLEEQIGPQTIELTDYEKEQEENAIISYKELLKVKDELYELNAVKENGEFIQDLKALRNNLNK